MAEVIDVGQLLQVQHVQVVQAVDLLGLEGLIKQLLDRQAATEARLLEQGREVDALKAAQAQHQETDGASAADAAQPELQDQLATLGNRLAAMEALQQSGPASAESATQQHPGFKNGPDSRQHSIHDQTSTTATAAVDKDADAPSAAENADLLQLKRQQQQLTDRVAEVAAKNDALQQQVSALQDSKADRSDVREMLADGLKAKADTAALNQLKAQLADKADRTELDALVDSLSGSRTASVATGQLGAPANEQGIVQGGGDTTAPPDASQPAHTATLNTSSAAPEGSSSVMGRGLGSRRGTREQQGAGDASSQISKLQMQVALLQDRMTKKADQADVAPLSEGLEAARVQAADLATALQTTTQEVASAQDALADLRRSLDRHVTDTAAHAGQQGPAAAAAGPSSSSPAASRHGSGRRDNSSSNSSSRKLLARGSSRTAAGESTTSDAAETVNPGAPLEGHEQQLPGLLARVQELEAALSSLQDAVAAAAAAAALQPPQPPRRVSGEAPASSRLVQALAGQLADLAAQVARLSAQHQAGGPAAQPEPHEADQTCDGGEAGTAQASPGSDAACAASDTAAGAGPVGLGLGLGAALAAELDGRLSELEQVVQELSVVKADQAGLQELRALLADTSTQSDTEQLRQQLTAQQSLLDRLVRQLSSTSSRSSRPQSAAGASHHHSSPAPAMAAECSFMPAGSCSSDTAGAGPAGTGRLFSESPAAAGAAAGMQGLLGPDEEALLQALQVQLQAQHESLEQLAQAVSLLATGQAAVGATGAPAGAAGGAATGTGRGALQVETDVVDLAAGRAAGDGLPPETPSLRQQPKGPAMHAPHTGGASAAAPWVSDRRSPAVGGSAGVNDGLRAASEHHRDSAASQQQCQQAGLGWAAAGPGPHVARVKRLLQTGQVLHKMDWFDPALLQKMAQRLAAVDAMLRGGVAAGASGPTASDADGKLRRLAADVRQLKDKLAELTAGGNPVGQAGWRGLGQAADGDYSMLSGKPLGGYRCMACDRPLATLDARPGPYLPTGQLPVSLPSGAEVAAGASAALGKLPPASPASRRGTAEAAAAASLSTDPLAASSPESRRAVGAQNGYTAVHGLPAEQLPKADVGPHLPPGGWRGTQPLKGGEEGALLPMLRGGSSGHGGTPRAGTAAGGAGTVAGAGAPADRSGPHAVGRS